MKMEISSENDVTSVTLPEKKHEGGSLSFSFSGINTFALYTQKKKYSVQSVKDVSENKIHLLEQHCVLFDDVIRKLVNESNSTFQSTRNVPSNIHYTTGYFLSLSHEHRSSIRQCIENMQMLEDKIPHYKEWIEMFDNIEILWHLCELLHLDPPVGDFAVGRLVEWVRFNCCEVELRACRLMGEEKPDVTCPQDFWELATGLLLQARFEATRAFLKLHSYSHTLPFLEADNILLTIPVFTVESGFSESEFRSKWRGWKSAVKSKIASGIFSQHPELLEIMQIVAGEGKDLLTKIKKYCDTWYQLLSASLVFIDPIARLSDLPYYSQLCINEFSTNEPLKLLDQTVQAIIESNLPLAVSILEKTADGGWSAVHLANLLHTSGCFTPQNTMANEVETLLIDYASLLFKDSSLYTTGVSYLEHCPNRGKATLATLLSSLPIDSEQRAYKLIGIANRNNLYSVCENICRYLCCQYLKEGCLNSALQWALESKSAEVMSLIADKFLHSYTTDVTFMSPSLLYLGSSTSASERLTFAAKFAEYNHLWSMSNHKEATDLLINLIDVKVVPKFFYSRIVHELLQLVDYKPSTLTTSQALVILEFLDDLSEDIIGLDKINFLRPAVSRLLAETMVSDLTADVLPSRKVMADRSAKMSTKCV